MGQYDRYVGDIEDYTDEEVCDFNIGAIARERIVRMRLAWCWVMVRRERGLLLPREGAVADVLAGRGSAPGKLRPLAQELYALVTVPEDGAGQPVLEQWRVDGGAATAARLQKMLGAQPIADLCTLYSQEVRGVLTLCATMMKAIPRYNRSVRNSVFPEAMWTRGTKQMVNKAMLRFERELELWEQCQSSLKEGQ